MNRQDYHKNGQAEKTGKQEKNKTGKLGKNAQGEERLNVMKGWRDEKKVISSE